MNIIFGTYRLDPKIATEMAQQAIAHGIPNIDTAQLYNTEHAIGCLPETLRVHITTKIHRKIIQAAATDPHAIRDSLVTSFKNIKRINCVLLHSPEPGFLEAWRQLVAFQNDSQLRGEIPPQMGVSNFGIEHLETIRQSGMPMPSVNQIEITPFNQCKNLVMYCKSLNIKITAHSSLTKGEKFSNPILKQIAKKHECAVATVLINWSIAEGFVPIIRTKSVDHLKEDIVKIALDDSDLHLLGQLEEGFQTHPQYNSVKI